MIPSFVEPGLVKFESDTISRAGFSMDPVSVVRGGSAGHLERSLKLARKREVDGETPRRNSTGAEIIGKGKYQQNRKKLPYMYTINLSTK